MNLKILCWNVRGLHARDKRATIKTFLKGVRADILCLQETKLASVDRSIVRELWGGHCVDWECLPARGSSGGILLCWDSRVVVREEVEIGGFSVSCLFRSVEDGFRWVFTGVYGPVLGVERSGFFDELASVAFRWEEPWCIGGDLML